MFTCPRKFPFMCNNIVKASECYCAYSNFKENPDYQELPNTEDLKNINVKDI